MTAILMKVKSKNKTLKRTSEPDISKKGGTPGESRAKERSADSSTRHLRTSRTTII